jgi:hypothetical protein
MVLDTGVKQASGCLTERVVFCDGVRLTGSAYIIGKTSMTVNEDVSNDVGTDHELG